MEEDEEGEQPNNSPIRDDIPRHTSLGIDITFNAINLTCICLLLHEDFLGDYQAILHMAPQNLSGVVENHMLGVCRWSESSVRTTPKLWSN